MKCSIRITCCDIFRESAVIASGYRRIRKQIETGFKEASSTQAFRSVGKNFRSAFSTNPGCAAHDGRVARARSIMYCAEFCHTLRSQHSDQMSQLIFDIAGYGDSVTDFFAQHELIRRRKEVLHYLYFTDLTLCVFDRFLAHRWLYLSANDLRR